MCTIYTFSKQFYTENHDAVVKQIKSDAVFNGHGYSMLAIGRDSDTTELIRTMNVASLLRSLDTLLGPSGEAERAWIHLRYATTGFHGLNGAHGFAAGDYNVFHNGILRRKESDSFHVDSELIAHEIDTLGLEGAIEAIGANEKYVNAFLVNNQTGSYTVIRMTTGSLYTDGAGNYSSTPINDTELVQPVAENIRVDFGAPIVVPRPVMSRLALLGRGSARSSYYGDADDAEYADRFEHRLDDPSDADLDTDTLHQLWAFDECESAEEFAEVAEEYMFDTAGFPEKLYCNFDVSQLTWFERCGFYYVPDTGNADLIDQGA